MALSALLWDVDGTLAETELDGHRVAFDRAFQDARLPWRWDPPLYTRLLTISGGKERLRAFLHEVEGRPPAPERVEALQRSKQEHYAALVASGQLSLRPGVARLVREVADGGVPQAIVTTSGRRAVEALMDGLMADLRPCFSFWICGEDVARKKPDPQAYGQALDRLVCRPEGVLAIEDSRQGLEAASGAGLSCLLTLSGLSRSEPLAGFTAARAVVEGLGDAHGPACVRRGPPCPQGRITLSYLHRLLAP